MKIIRKIKQAAKACRQLEIKGKTIGFVPTMGALHEGHLSLIRRARRENDAVVVSIFVNPAQFGPREDLKKYPRDLNRDTRLCSKEGVDILFYPNAKEIYPDNYRTYVQVEALSDLLCGKSRAGHFKGVATIVTKLFNLISPNIAYFGLKDAQQAIIIKKMVGDLNIPTKIKVLPIVRERDGLAMSSRNTYLNKKERLDALVLSQSLKLSKNLIKRGVKDTGVIIHKMGKLIRGKKTAKIDYISVVNLENLESLRKIKKNCLIAIAVWIGKTRLIDNIVIRNS